MLWHGPVLERPEGQCLSGLAFGGVSALGRWLGGRDDLFGGDSDHLVDMVEVESLAKEHRPKPVIAGWSALS